MGVIFEFRLADGWSYRSRSCEKQNQQAATLTSVPSPSLGLVASE